MTDSILALTKSSPVPVGPGTRRKAKHFQPPATRSGFRAKRSTGTKAVPLKKQDSTDIFNVMYDVLYGSPYRSGVDVDQINLWRNSDETSTATTVNTYGQDWSKVFRDPFTADYGSLDKQTDYRTAGYLREFINPERLKERIQAVVDALTPELDKFDSIAFTGMSGALIGPPVALALGKEVIMVRKKGHGSHSSYKVEGNYESKRYIMVDDGRSSGGTEEHVIMSIRDAMPRAEYVGFMSAIFAEDYSEDRKDRGTAIRPALSKSWRPDTF